MNPRSNIYRVLSVVGGLSLVFLLLSLFRLPTQLYVWEILLDARVLSVFLAVFLLHVKKFIAVPTEEFSLKRFGLWTNVAAFFAPLMLYGIVILTGWFAGSIRFESLDNAGTSILATVFDIPALYVFSFSTILLEEMVFRSVLRAGTLKSFSRFIAFAAVNILWGLYCMPEYLSGEEWTVATGSVLFLFFLSAGLFLLALTERTKSIWAAYSFRVGIMTLTPILLTSRINESDSFFTTTSELFTAEGVVMSALLLTLSLLIFSQLPKTVEMDGKRNFS